MLAGEAVIDFSNNMDGFYERQGIYRLDGDIVRLSLKRSFLQRIFKMNEMNNLHHNMCFREQRAIAQVCCHILPELPA